MHLNPPSDMSERDLFNHHSNHVAKIVTALAANLANDYMSRLGVSLQVFEDTLEAALVNAVAVYLQNAAGASLVYPPSPLDEPVSTSENEPSLDKVLGSASNIEKTLKRLARGDD